MTNNKIRIRCCQWFKDTKNLFNIKNEITLTQITYHTKLNPKASDWP